MFSRKKKFKFTIQNRIVECPTTNVPNCVRVAKCPATNVQNHVHVVERPVTNVLNRVHVAKRPRPRLQAQEYYINYNYKSNSQEYIQSIIKYTNYIHIIINVLELAFRSHEGVDTEDFYLSQTLGHGRRL